MVNKSKILTWVIVLLVVLNLSTIASIFYHHIQEKKLSAETIQIEGQAINGRFIRDNVGYNDEQLKAFREANLSFRPVARQIIIQIDSLKNEMFRELQKPVSDTLKLKSTSKQVGDLHGQLKEKTFEYYLKLKAFSTGEQLVKLEKIFTPLFNNVGTNMRPGMQGSGPGKGMGRRAANNY